MPSATGRTSSPTSCAYTSQEENSNRVGEFAIGTNIARPRRHRQHPAGREAPGLHLAFGHPYSEHTGANWKCRTHIDIVGRHFDVWFDGDQIMAGFEVSDLKIRRHTAS